MIKPFANGATLDLAPYESASAIWKECKLLERISEDTAVAFLNVMDKVYAVMDTLTIRGSEKEVFETASKESLTVYDASYLYMAVRNGLTLVTDDHKLKEKASKYIKTLCSKEVIPP